jgi:fatty acid desaturase
MAKTASWYLAKHKRKVYKKLNKMRRKVGDNMFVRFLIALLNGIITLVVLGIIVVILGMVGLGAIGAVLSVWILAIALLVGLLTFFGVIPNYFPNLIK